MVWDLWETDTSWVEEINGVVWAWQGRRKQNVKQLWVGSFDVYCRRDCCSPSWMRSCVVATVQTWQWGPTLPEPTHLSTHMEPVLLPPTPLTHFSHIYSYYLLFLRAHLPLLIKAHQPKVTWQYNDLLFFVIPLVWKLHCVFHSGLAWWSFLPSLHPVSSAKACQPASVHPVCVQVPAASPRTLRLRSSLSMCDSPPALPCLPPHSHTFHLHGCGCTGLVEC